MLKKKKTLSKKSIASKEMKKDCKVALRAHLRLIVMHLKRDMGT